jgi:hypothetical protein
MPSPFQVRSVLNNDDLKRVPDPLLVRAYRRSERSPANALPAAETQTVVTNDGRDTLVTLGDGSTILVKGVANIDATFFA